MKTPLSASQFETFACLRRGALEYVHGLKGPPTPGLIVGSAVHKVAEEYLRGGTEPDFEQVIEVAGKTYMPGQIFHPAIQHLPPVGTAIVEGDMECETPNSKWRGARDFIYTPGSPRVIGNGHIRLGDYKTTKNKKYVKTKEELQTGIQPNLYGYSLYEDGAELVDGLWIYLATTGKPQAWPVLFALEKQRVYDIVGVADERAVAIHAIKEAEPEAADVPYNTSRCDDYGGCPHRGKGCKISATEMFNKKGEVGMASILDRLKARKVDGAGTPVDSKGFSITKGHDFDTGTGERLIPIESVLVEQAEAARAAGHTYGIPEQGFVNPPDLEPYVSSTDGQGPVVDVHVAVSPDVVDEVIAANEMAASGPMSREELKAACVLRGLCDANDRRREPALRALLALHALPPQVERTGEELVSAMQKQPEHEKFFLAADYPGQVNDDFAAMNIRSPKEIDTLYIGCLPSSPVCDAQSIVAEVLPKVLETLGNHGHHKLGKEAEYGRGTALLAAAVEEYLSTRHYPAVFADRFLDADVLQVLVRLSGAVVRGL